MENSKEKIIVTAALPYSNGELHLGHIASTYLPADIFVKFQKLLGNEVIYVCGTDDYGVPVLVSAEKQGMKPEEFVKIWWDRDEKDLRDVGIDFDVFGHTHSPNHRELVQHFFKILFEKGLIFKQEIEQYYCEKDKKFLPDRYVKGTCPYCGAEDQYGDACEVCGRTYSQLEVKNPRCAICGETPVKKKSLHYFFKLSAFANKLEKWLKENNNLQEDVKNYVLSWIKEGLKDWDITRDISWGVPIPLDEANGKVLYGWFDNHIGYISFILDYCKQKGIDGNEFWNSAKIYHFIGKDIVYHHYIFLPAMRMAEGNFKLPDFIPTRGYFLLEGKKLSKSRKWYISIREFLEKYPADYLRYYLSISTPYSQKDINFTWQDFEKRINNELIANFGNFVFRVLSFIWKNFGGKIPKAENIDGEFLKEPEKTKEKAFKLMNELKFSQALKEIMNFAKYCNAYFQEKEPWRTKDMGCLFICVNAIANLAILLYPFIPFSSKKIWKMLNLDEKKMKWDNIGKLFLEEGHKINKPEILFRKVEI